MPCIAEAPVLQQLKARGVAIDGIAIRDRPEDIAAIPRPTTAIRTNASAATAQSRVQIALGSSGVPESFVVDGRGMIRYQHVGPIEPRDMPAILAELEEAR